MDLISSINNLQLTSGSAESDGQERRNGEIHRTFALQRAVRALTEAAEAVNVYAQDVRDSIKSEHERDEQFFHKIASLQRENEKIAQIVASLSVTKTTTEEALIHSILTQLAPKKHQQQSVVLNLYTYFTKEIKQIIGTTLRQCSGRNLSWKIVEDCYRQASEMGGCLHSDNYFDALEDNSLELPFDLDFESEAYYEHENRLGDEAYARAQISRANLRAANRRRERKKWPQYWLQLVNNSPGGPTLFDLDLGDSTGPSHISSVPPYLFRTFDARSSGRSDEVRVASPASLYKTSGRSRLDILTLDKHLAASLLQKHLDKPCFGGPSDDNLMSWTSSFPFAIQYALWRCANGQYSSAHVYICIVDTHKFPKGQFVQDIALIQTFDSTARQIGGPAHNFLQFRLNRKDFYNGEYLSQGLVHHQDRSNVVSLYQLLHAGLDTLYPEFEQKVGKIEWTKRVQQLRLAWGIELRTTDEEIKLAINIARQCFPQIDLKDVACIMLCFRKRALQTKKTKKQSTSLTCLFNSDASEGANEGQLSEYLLRLPQPMWAEKPDEVHRQWHVAEALKYQKANMSWKLRPMFCTAFDEIRDLLD